jgi:hypothetical protein
MGHSNDVNDFIITDKGIEMLRPGEKKERIKTKTK